ncbi:hypothetical protein OG365_17170 [Streptomyces sp. NBC_00853]|uniref:hypothetical protein n=1 Tax=Streptomyces sp. NBC_00853 TaxID=2903681 RepID=UPI003872FD7D|nr:hypothetical protein OG365_17170 [Streptomyces sp. NBC_00853]
MARTKIRTTLATVAATAVLALGTGVLAASPAHAAGSWHGCPSGAVCIYPQDAGWNNDRPSQVYWEGVYRLYGQEGTHFVVNNQTGGWVDRLCYDSYGSNCDAYVQPPGTTWQLNLSPMNSIKLSRY